MNRTGVERVADVRSLLAATRRVHERRGDYAAALVRSTGLSPAGVELGFESLERGASTEDLESLVTSAGNAAHVHVILSANVFVAPLRAIAIARAASARVTVQASSREPVLSHALVVAAGDPAITMATGRAVPDGADRIDVYGRDETIAEVRASARRGVVVRGHGAGLGVGIVTMTATATATDTEPPSIDEAAHALASDVVPFDQRGCLSPRVVFVEGALARGERFAEALHESLSLWSLRVARGALAEAERAEANRWRDAMTLAGAMWSGDHHAVSLAPSGWGTLVSAALPPPGRHVLVVPVAHLGEAAAALAPIARFVVTVGTNDPDRLMASAAKVVPSHARLARFGSMQKPPLDGPVDRRGSR